MFGPLDRPTLVRFHLPSVHDVAAIALENAAAGRSAAAANVAHAAAAARRRAEKLVDEHT